MTFYIPYWQVMVSGGDGSAFVRYFTTKELAEAYYKAESEPFCDAIYPPGTIMLNPGVSE